MIITITHKVTLKEALTPIRLERGGQVLRYELMTFTDILTIPTQQFCFLLQGSSVLNKVYNIPEGHVPLRKNLVNLLQVPSGEKKKKS